MVRSKGAPQPSSISPIHKNPETPRSSRRLNEKRSGSLTAEKSPTVSTPRSSHRKRKRTEVDIDGRESLEKSPIASTPTRTDTKGHTNDINTSGPRKSKESQKLAVHPEVEAEVVQPTAPKPDKTSQISKESAKPKRSRKTKEEKEADAMPLAARTSGLKMLIGAHVSCAKGVHNSVANSVHIGGNAFAMFLKSQRKWDNPPLQDEHRELFRENAAEQNYDASKHVLPHGSYLVNLAQPDPEKAKQAYNGFIDDLHRCDALGIKLYNFHPGTTGPYPRPAAISRIASALNRAIEATQTVVPVLETMATRGSNVIGSTFEDIRDIIAQVKNKERVGVCIDTCHVFAAGYDLRQPKEFKETLEEFEKIIGLQYLKALHLNDSKAPLGAGRDLHQNIGSGFLGLRAFHNVVNEKRFEGLPMILETPIDKKDEKGKDVEDKGVWAQEIKLLESLIGMDVESDEFKALEKSLAAKGGDERQKHQVAFQRKKEKIEKGQMKLNFGKKGKKNLETDDEMET